ncbi:MAG: hypothetical protein RJA70_3549 [Pseudomonadota bacterium]|jgi:hypothetical protein
MLTSRIWLLVLCLFAIGCKSQSERELQAEVDKLSVAVNALRDAPHNQKEAPTESLRSIPCVQASACEYKQICLQAYELHQKSTQATQEVRELIRAGATDPAAATQLLKLGERELARARDLTARCVELQGVLERATL